MTGACDGIQTLAAAALRQDPMDPTTSLGALGTRPQYKKVLGYLDVAKTEGAKVLLGGAAARPECGKGWLSEPTLFEVKVSGWAAAS